MNSAEKVIIVFGGTGRVGQVLSAAARSAGWCVLDPARSECDLLVPGAASDYVLAHPEASAVVNCAAIASPDACECDPLNAHLVNALSPGEIALACRHTGARFVHLSTDYVLDGRRPGLKSESAPCRPCSVYGMSKYEGEQQIADVLPDALVLRVSWVCGNPLRPAFPECIVARALRGEPLAAIADKFSLPSHVRDIADVILFLLANKTEQRGVLHLCSRGEPMSWHDIATVALRSAVDFGALRETPPVARQHLADASFFRSPRPVHTALDSAALHTLFPLPSAEDTISRAVRDYLQMHHTPSMPQASLG